MHRILDIDSRVEKIERGHYRIVVVMPNHDAVFFAQRCCSGWWLQNVREESFMKCPTLKDCRIKAEDIEFEAFG